MWQLKMLLPKYLTLALDQEIGEDVLAISCFEKDEKSLMWTLEALYEERPAESTILSLIPQGTKNEIEWELSELEDKNWLEENRKSFAPIQVGCFYIHGSHITENLPEDKICIQLDASTAFGSGEHATTKGCLHAIEDICSTRSFKKPMDMGCGTGILAFAVASLLKTKVWAVDNDPEAIHKTVFNARAIGLENLIEAGVSTGWSEIQDNDFDLVVANILAGPLCDLAPNMKEHMKDKGVLILAGLLETQKPQLIEAYGQQEYQLKREYPVGEWTTLVMMRG